VGSGQDSEVPPFPVISSASWPEANGAHVNRQAHAVNAAGNLHFGNIDDGKFFALSVVNHANSG
jgi:hypothetical protein